MIKENEIMEILEKFRDENFYMNFRLIKEKWTVSQVTFEYERVLEKYSKAIIDKIKKDDINKHGDGRAEWEKEDDGIRKAISEGLKESTLANIELVKRHIREG